MDKIDLHNQEIELVFQNCECIYVDMWAIKYLRFVTADDEYLWDNDHKSLLKTTELKSFKIVLDLTDSKNFHHTNRLVDAGVSIDEDGKQSIDRLRHSDDLTTIYVNGKGFRLPWVYEKYKRYLGDTPFDCYRNAIQKNSEVTDSPGGHTLTIEVCPDTAEGV